MSIVRVIITARLLAGCFLAFSSLACSGSADSSAANPASGGEPAAGAANAGAFAGAPVSSSGGKAGDKPSSGGSSSGGAMDQTGGAGSAVGGTAGNGLGSGGAVGGTGGTAQAGSGGQEMTGGRAGAGGASAGSGGGEAVSCPGVALKPGTTTHMIQSGGRSREYLLRVPSGYTGSSAVPLIVDFHGHGGTGTSQSKDSPYPKVVDADNVVMAFPTAIGDWNMGPCCADDIDDIEFSKALVADVRRLGCIDPKRVYAAGFSMGGGMSHQLACRAADVFAAVAPAAFDLLQEHLATCKSSRPITVVAFRGTDDTLAPYKGGLSNLVRPINFLGAVASMKKWGELNGCSGASADLGNNCQGFTASQCPAGVEAIVCSKAGGGHEQGNAALGWPVLKRHQLP